MIITNGLLVGEYDNIDDWGNCRRNGSNQLWTNDRWRLDVHWSSRNRSWHVQYPLNAGRLKLGIKDDGDLAGKLFVSSGLGGMSGAQG